ncbi:RidA family protein [Asticcacaulis sp. EMRT-3]|uniref:RidA family protein n=1 Tax=Asticcacaulis sp. EMRT-3 TaxID=3040349 RepID=UPI0024AF0873|nr:RidA family protein [Asticcacaulis sp. EMRT-3]MDI7775941.1 RidA family protein [Asticcacaulis sp. EMRT-3]
MIHKASKAIALVGFASLLAAPAFAQTAPAAISRLYAKPDAFLATSAAVPDGYKIIYLSGQLADVADPAAPKGTVAAYGDTETQTESVLNKLDAALQAQGATMNDVVNMHVYLAGDPNMGGKMDFAGMMKAYLRHFGTATTPNRPTRAAFQVANLAAPGFLVEIEVVAAVPQK